MTDPPYPGAVGEIVNLGQYWDRIILEKHKNDIIDTKNKISRLFKTAYSQLAEAQVIKNELDSYYDEAINWTQVNRIIYQISQSLFNNTNIQFDRPAKERHLFASALAPAGQVHHLDSILQDIEELYFITGSASAIGCYLVETIAKIAHRHGLNIEVYHCPLEPERADLVVMPALKTAVLKEIPGINFYPQALSNIKEVKLFNLDNHLYLEIIKQYENEIANCQERLWAAINRGLQYIAAAKANHDQLESYYIPAMNYQAINNKRQEILESILRYA